MKQRKTKLGAMSTAVTVLVIAVVIIFNGIFKALADSYLWYLDMTKEQVYSLSDEVIELLSDVTADVNICFTQEKEDLMSGTNSNEYMKYVYQTAEQLEKQFPNIHVKCVDIIENPAFFEYYYNTAATSILTTNVIIESGSEFRLMASDAFFVWDEERTEIWAYDGEAKFAASILQVTLSEMPTVYFTTGHGEAVSDNAKALWELYETAGFEVKTIDLSKEDIDENGRILVINNPVYDFAGYEAGSETKSEIEKVDSFLDEYGTVMLFTSPENSGNLANISEFLNEWGIQFRPNEVVVDKLNSISTDGKAIVAKYETENTLGASLYNDISKLSSMPKTIFNRAMPLDITFDENIGISAEKMVSPVLYSDDGATVVKDGKTVSEGSEPIAALAREQRVEDNDYFYTYLFVCGSDGFASDDYLNSNSYANSDILVNLARLTGREKVVADLDIKVLDDTALDITTAQANNWSIAMVVVIPVIIAVCGTVVYIRRKRK